MQIRQVTIAGYTATIEPDRTVTIDRAGELIAEARWDERRGMIYGDHGALTPSEIAEWSAALRATPPRTMTCTELYNRIGDEDMEALTSWLKLANAGSVHLGGRGRSRAQIKAAADAWDRLSETAKAFHNDMHYATERELVDALREEGIPANVSSPIDAIERLLGPIHPAWFVLSVYDLVILYEDAVAEVEGVP